MDNIKNIPLNWGMLKDDKSLKHLKSVAGPASPTMAKTKKSTSGKSSVFDFINAFEENLFIENADGGFDDDFKIDYFKLINYIQYGVKNTLLLPYSRDIFSGSLASTKYSAEGIPYSISVPTDIAYSYAENMTLKDLSVKADLNKKTGYIDFYKTPYLTLTTDLEENKITFNLIYQYKDFKTSTANDRIAIILKFTKYRDYKYFVNISGYATTNDELKIRNEFKKAFAYAEGNATLLNWLYSEAPDYMISERTKETLWTDLLLLLNRDDKGMWSWFKDSSNAIIKILQSGGHEFIEFSFKNFYANPALVTRIYHALDESSEMKDGSIETNRTIFCSILSAMCNMHVDINRVVAKTFVISPGYKIDSHILPSSDKNDGKVYLRLIKLKQTEAGGVLHYDPLSRAATDVDILKTDYLPFDEGVYYNPLDLVYITVEQKDTRINKLAGGRYVPAIFVKDIADTQKWEEINQRIRIGIDILTIAISIPVLMSNPASWIMLLSAIDLGVASIDVILVSIRRDLTGEALKEFDKFFEVWNKVYTWVGLATATPLTITSFFKYGNRLLNLLKSGQPRKYLIGMIYSVLMQINILRSTQHAFRFKNIVIIQLVEVSNKWLPQNLAKDMMALGVLFCKGTLKESAEEVQMAFYNGDLFLLSNTLERNVEGLKNARNAFGKEGLESLIRRLWSETPVLEIEKKFWTCYNRAGFQLRWGNMTIENILDAINKAITSSNAGRAWEGLVGEAFSKIDSVIQFGSKVEGFMDGKWLNFGDFDVLTSKFIIECKTTISDNNLRNILDQCDKYLNPLNPKYINVGNRRLVLAIKDYNPNSLHSSTKNGLEKFIQDNSVIFITDIKQIKNLK